MGINRVSGVDKGKQSMNPVPLPSSVVKMPPTQVSKERVSRPKYNVKLTFNPALRKLEGVTEINMWNRSKLPTKEIDIQLFLKAFEKGQSLPVLPTFYSAAFPNGRRYGTIDIIGTSVSGQPVHTEIRQTVLTLKLNKEWMPNEKTTLILKWQATIPEIHHRVGMEKDAFWFGNTLPVLAVYDGNWEANNYEIIGDPFFSEVSDYHVEITTPSQYKVVATGDEVELLIKNNRKTTVVTAEQVRDFAFAITSNHKLITAKTKAGVQVNLYYRKADDLHAKRILQNSVEMLDYMGSRVAPYPYRELDIFENEMFITGMEYPGIVFIQSKRLQSPTGNQTVLHEIAHQWFYNLVGNNQLKDPWLDEGMATYFTDEFVKGKVLQSYYSAQLKQINKTNPNLPIQNVYVFKDWSTYWRSDYRKSSLMIFYLREKMGETAFENFIKSYVKEFRFGIVSTDQFKKFAQKYVHEDLTPFFEKWF